MSTEPLDTLIKVIIDSIQRKPETASEAIALFRYVMEKDIQPLVAQLKKWVISAIEEKDKILALKTMEWIHEVEAQCMGRFC
jgi:hypothetical protein